MPEVLAAFLGGSDATGRTDELSDVDLVVVVEEGAVEAAFATVHAALEELSPIVHRWRLADPTWHGNSQEFLSLRDADPAHFIDLVVQEPAGGERFLEVGAPRHRRWCCSTARGSSPRCRWIGRPCRPGSTTRLAVLRERFPLFQTLVTRAVRRGFVAEAAVAYQDHTYRPLIELLRIRHCPDRFDYGARYLDRDLPPALRAEVEALALPGSLDEVEAFRGRAQALFDATLAELARRADPEPQPAGTRVRRSGDQPGQRLGDAVLVVAGRDQVRDGAAPRGGRSRVRPRHRRTPASPGRCGRRRWPRPPRRLIPRRVHRRPSASALSTSARVTSRWVGVEARATRPSGTATTSVMSTALRQQQDLVRALGLDGQVGHLRGAPDDRGLLAGSGHRPARRATAQRRTS